MSIRSTSYARGMAWSLGANLAGMVAGLASTALAVRMLGKEELGVFFIILAVTQLAAVLGDIGVRNTAIRALSEATEREREPAAQYFFTVNLLASLFAAAVVALALPVLQQVWPYPEFERSAWFCIPATMLTVNFQMATSLLVGARRFEVLALVNGGCELLRVALSVTCLLVGWGIAGLLWSLIVSRIAGIALTAVALPGQFRLTLAHPSRGEFLRFGGWLYGSSLVSVATARAADALLTSYMGPAALAIYSAAMQLPSGLQRMFESIRPVLLGYTSAQTQGGLARLTSEVRLLSGLLAIAALMLAALSEPLIVLLYSRDYTAAVDVMRMLCVWVAISVVNYYLSIFMIGAGRAREVFWLTLPQFVVMVIATLSLVPRFSGLGAAVALVMTAAVGSLTSCRVLAGAESSLFRALGATLLKAFIPVSLACWFMTAIDDGLLVLIGLITVVAGCLFALRAVRLSDITGLYAVFARTAPLTDKGVQRE